MLGAGVSESPGAVRCPKCGRVLALRIAPGVIEIRHKGIAVWPRLPTVVECPGNRDHPCKRKTEITY